MNLLSLMERFLNSGENELVINAEYCVRLKSPMASCYSCINRCPELAVEISDTSIKISGSCTLCKMCFYICPNYVFDIKKGIDILDAGITVAGNVYYFCSEIKNKVKAKSEEIKTVSCINEIDEIDIINHLKRDKNIYFVTGICGSCKNNFFYKSKIKQTQKLAGFFTGYAGSPAANSKKNGEQDDGKRIKAVNFKEFNFSIIKNYLNDAAGNAEDIKDVEDKTQSRITAGDEPQVDLMERRHFFKEVGKTIKKHAAAVIEDLPLDELPFSELISVENKKSNKLFFKKRYKLFSFLKSGEDSLNLLNIRLPRFNNNCIFCGNCWELCPTGALEYKNKSIFLEPYLCTGCNLCRDLCSFGAVTMRKVKQVEELGRKKNALTNTGFY